MVNIKLIIEEIGMKNESRRYSRDMRASKMNVEYFRYPREKMLMKRKSRCMVSPIPYP